MMIITTCKTWKLMPMNIYKTIVPETQRTINAIMFKLCYQFPLKEVLSLS